MTNPRPKGGRPTELDAHLTLPGPDGTTRTVTVEERIIELMATGAHVDTAAASIGVMRPQLHEWLRIGAKANKDITAGRRTHPDDPTRDPDMPTIGNHETRCLRFSFAVDAAQAEWLMRQEATLETVSRPRQHTVTTVKTDAAGATVESSTRTETEIPDMATVRWRLERHPASRDTYGRTTHAVELSGPDGEAIPVDLRISTITDKIAALRAKPELEEETPDDDPGS